MKALLGLLGVVGVAAVAWAGPELPEAKESKAMVTPEPTPYNWTGFYVGVNGGYVFDFDVIVSDLDLLNVGPPVQSFSYDANGPIVGGVIGFNWQPWVHLVLGIEADGGYLGVHSDPRQPGSPAPGTFAETDPGYYAMVLGRIGFAWDRWLLYAAGGWMGANYEREIEDEFVCSCGFPLGSASNDDWRSGWVVGGGVEWAFRDHWSFRVEYLYFDMGDSTLTVPIFRTGPFRFGFDESGQLIRGGLSFKFW